MLRVTTEFSGLPGLPGYCNLYFVGDDVADATAVHSRVQSFMEDIAGFQNDQVVNTVLAEVRAIDPDDGSTTDVFTLSTVAFPGTATQQPLPSATQMMIRLQTSTLRRNRVVRGHFGIPGVTDGADNDTGGVGAAVVTAAGALLPALVGTATTTPMLVWGRPLPAREGFPAAVGIAAAVTSASIWDQWSVQRSRRP